MRGLRRNKGHKSSATCTPSSPTKKYRGYWGQTTHNSAAWHKYEEAPYPRGRHEMSHKGRTSTLQYSKASSMPWQRLPDRSKIDTPSKRGSWKRPSTIFNERGSQCSRSTRSGHSKRPHWGIKKTEERSTSTYHAKTGYVAPPSGSSGWMEEKWPGTPRMTRQGISPSLPTSTPPKNTTMMTMTT